MNPKELEKNYQENKNILHDYIDKIKETSKWDIYTIVNATLIKNPYASQFPKNLFLSCLSKKKYINIIKFYLKNFYFFFSYVISFFIYKIVYKKTRRKEITTVIDIFGLVDKTIKDNEFHENYLIGVYDVFQKYNREYTILIRPYGMSKNPFKLISFFKIINQSHHDFIFEYELLNFSDFIKMFIYILLYPFKTFRLLQKEKTDIDKIFNQSLINDILSIGIDSFSRYILGKKLAKIKTIKSIYSWSEFQVVERAFNYGIRTQNPNIELIALQFYLNYETYFNAYVDDIDFDMLSSPHRVLVNGKYYLKDREKVEYKVGVSLRYKDIFSFNGIEKEENILLLGSYIEQDTQYMLSSVEKFKNVLFKNHPAVNIEKFGKLNESIKVVNSNIYDLFKESRLVIATASGTAVEAVACGLSVIIVASQNNLTANPLVEHGKGKIWDIAFSKDDIEKLYNLLLKYRLNNPNKIAEIASWYRDNFFVEPKEENVIKIFELEKNR